MAQKLIQTQTQQQLQQQRLSQQQMLQVKLLEMPLAELEQHIEAELDDNPALEQRRDDLDAPAGDSQAGDDGAAMDDGTGEDGSGDDDFGDDDFDNAGEQEERADALDNALESLGSDDELPVVEPAGFATRGEEREEMVWGNSTSFYDSLMQQLGETELTQQQHDIIEYLIGSLDNDGLLRKDLGTITDELAIYHGIDVPEEEIARLLRKLQAFDPAGIGARSLQECLLLQVERRPKSRLRDLMESVIRDNFELFTKKHWDKIAQALQLTSGQAEVVRDEIMKLNPKPGAALGEAEGRSLQQITPDFTVDTDDEGNVSFVVNDGHVPDLKVSASFADLVDTYRTNRQNMNRQEKEALLYAKEKVERAQGYIEAVRQRRHTLYVTMKAIINWQRKYFLTGDETDLKPMILKDIAGKTGLDISTISRVSNMKYAQTRWGTHPLRFFFSDGYVTKDGEEMSTRKVRLVLKELIDHEDKDNPLSDDALSDEMRRKGYPIARRTVAKYREMMGFPVARMRKT